MFSKQIIIHLARGGGIRRERLQGQREMETFRSWKRITTNYRFPHMAVATRVILHVQYTCLISIQSPLTFLKAIPERAWAAHGASLLIKRHAGVSQAVVTERVKGDVLIGQAVVTQTGKVNLSCWSRTGRCENEEDIIDVCITGFVSLLINVFGL